MLLPTLGIVASAYAALICYSVMVIVAYVLGQKIYAIDYPLVGLVRTFGLIVVIMICGYFFRTESIWINCLIGCGLVGIYLALIYFFEKQKIKQYF